MLILKQNAANTVPTPPSGKGTIFLDDSDVLSVKTSDGNVENFPTVAASNSQVVFIDGTSLSGDNSLLYNFNTNVLTLTGNVAAGNVKTDNLLYANGNPWDLSDPGGSNTEIQFNDDESFGGSSAFTFNKTTNAVSMGGALTVTGNASAGNLSTGGVLSVTGNANVGNLGTAGLIVATGNVTGGNLVTSGTGSVGELAVSGNAVITGNLAVNGNVVYVNVETLDVEDPIIVLGGGPNGAAPTTDDGKDRGTQLQYYSGSAKNAFMGWDNSNAEFGMGAVVSIVNDVVTFSTYGNLRVANIIGNGQALSGLTGANVTGTVANATHASTANTVVDAAQPNITSVGTLSSVAVTGNASANNFNAATYVVASSVYANAGTVAGDFVSANTDVTANRNLHGGNVYANSGLIQSNNATVTATLSAGNVKTDNLLYANGNPWDLSDPGGSNTAIQFNDDESFGGSAAFTFDKSSNLVSVTANLDANNLNATTHITSGNVWANSGTIGASLLTGTLTTASQPNVTSLGTLSGLSVNGNITAANITANTGVFTGNGSGLSALAGANVTGTVANATHASTANTVVDAAQPNITSVGTLTSLAVTGNATAGNVYANSGTVGASLLTGTLTTAAQPNVTSLGTLSSLAVTGNVAAGNVYSNSGTIGASLLTGTLTTASQPNVTAVGTLTGLAVNGNITAANITANTGVFTGNGSGLSAIAGANVTGTVANATHSSTANTVVDAAQANITSVGTLTGLSVDGSNITLANGVFVGNGSGLSALAGANVTGTVANATHASTANTVVDAAQPNITSVGTLTSLAVTGNASAGNISTAGIFSGNGSGLSAIAGANVTGEVTFAATANAVAGANVSGEVGFAAVANSVAGANVSGQVANALVAGTVYTAAQPNITSVGTLTSLAVTGNVSAGNVSATAGDFTSVSGNGSALTALNASNISTGTLAQARLANASVTLGSTALTLGATVTTVTGLSSVTSTTFVGALTGAATTAGTVTTAAQPNITSVGTLSSLAVTGNASAGNISTGGVLSVTGNANVGNIGATNGVFTSVSGNGSALTALTGANVTGQVGNALVSGTVYTNAQPNITSVGTLTGLTLGGNLAMGNYNITGLAEPVNSTDAATKQYVDSVAEGLHTHDSCNAATTGTLATISGGTVTYNNGSSGVGATLTTTGSYTTIDSVTLSDGMRILVKNEANAAHNGIYVRSSSTVLTRATDFDTPAEMAGGDFTFVNGGSLYDNTGWVMTDPVTTVGTSDVNWVQFSGAGTYTAGTGLTLTGSQFSVNASQTQITSVGTLGSLTVTGTATAGNLSTGGTLSVTGNANVGNIGAAAGVFTSVSGNGSALTALNASNISTGTLAQARLANASLTLGSTTLTLGGTTTTVAGLSSVTSTTFVGALTGAATTAGTVTTAAQPNITSVGTLSSLTIAANGDISMSGTGSNINGVYLVSATYFDGDGSNLSSIAGGNVTGTVANATYAVSAGSAGSATTAGTVTTAAQPNITSVGTLSSLSVSGNANVGNIGAAAGVFTTVSGSGAALTSLNGSNISTGTIAAARVATLNQNTTGYAATVSSAAQPNITSVGTLTSLSVSGSITNANLTTGANSTAGSITGNWTLTTGSRLQATYADLAEKYVSDADYEVGTVLVFGGEHEVTLANEFDSHRVAGVVSHNAAYIMNAGCEGEHVVDLALTGRVPVKVHGPVAKGDLMVTGENGHAVANNMARAGTILGKALQNFEGGSGIIEVVVGRV